MYPQIDYIRKQLSISKSERERHDLSSHLDTTILNHLGRLSHLISCFTEGKRDKFDSGDFLFQEFDTNRRKLLVKFLTFSGDLSILFRIRGILIFFSSISFIQ